ncbi:nonstructural protein [Blackfly microvirus SF02]|uniref:Nonstructural protein n=1 Tax=Blackfly microvirus SF02 TaxID=2576452 RepID=A0A4P8PJY7_9VIRU|nr:nonstructural protein [Blackfly microvirus SF02]
MYNAPFAAPTRGVAMRQLAEIVNSPGADSIVAKHPFDFDLMYMGTFDDTCAEFARVLDGYPQLVVNLKELQNVP